MQSLILDPPAMYAAMENVAYVKVHLHTSKILLLAMMAGMYLSVGVQALIAVTAPTTTPPLTVLGAAVFSYGLICIIHCGAELFTGNILMLMAVLNNRLSIFDVVLEWCLVWIGNLFGSVVFAVLMYTTGVNAYQRPGMNNASSSANDNHTRLCAVALSKANLQPWEMFTRGIFANFCVASAVLLAVSSKSAIGKIWGIMWPLVVFIVCSFEHSIANQYFFAAATIEQCYVKDHGYYWLNLALSSIGNIVGASILSIVYWFCYLRPATPGDASPKVAPYAK